METPYEWNKRIEAEFAAECTKAGRECLTPREAAKLFGVSDSTIRQAARAEKIRPVFVLHLGKPMPMYRLSDLVEYFDGRYAPDEALLAKMRANGVGCFMQAVSPGGWLFLNENHRN